MLISDNEGGLLQWSGKASVGELLRASRPSSQFPDGGRIHIYATLRLPVIQVMAGALLAAFRVRHGMKMPANLQMLAYREDSWSPIPTSSRSLADALEVLVHDPHSADVLIDFSDISEKRLKAVELLFVEANPHIGYVPSVLRKRTVDGSHEIPSELVQLEQDAAARRFALAEDWPTAATVSRTLGSTAGNASQLATRLRRAGELLGVYLPVPGGSWRFPRWQFRSDGQPVEHLKEILRVLREEGKFYDSQRRTTGWGEVEWFISRHVLLNGKTPAELLPVDPGRVLQAARTEFAEDA
ncbi:hypothetical protein [Stenotrophomonas sp. PS02289]|uniref:hypothetical protein n=1 Tax=Stenotrophomonas sp. PS02289 TaxID=2991422 RepID=UPI00249C67BE|nr:hypothetical protein [Stenotrophomonas sp. PS02289]